MASFTESATLLLRDRSSANINKINASLKRLFATAQKMRKMNLGLDTRKLSQAQTKIKAISRDISNLQRRRINIQANTAQLTRAQTQLARMRAQAARPITQRINTVNTGGGGRGGVGLGSGRGSGGRGSQQGMRFDLGFGLALNAFTLATQLATAALRALADAAKTRDRTNLQIGAGATKVQEEIIKRGAAVVPENATAIQFTRDQRAKFAQSLLGDIAPPDTMDPKSDAAQKWRAETALKISAELEKYVLPRQYAMNPDQTIEQSQEGLRQIVKTMNLASAEMVDRQGNLTQDSQRVLRAIQIAMAADPDIDPQLINTTARGLKTRAYGLSEDDLATVFINAGARGQRAGMELYRAMKSLTGNVDNANLNEQLFQAGIITGVERKKKGGIIAGSGEMVDQELFETDFAAWVADNITLPMNKALAEEAGVDIREVDKIANVQAKKISYLEKKFAAMPQNALQAVSDYVLGEKQQQAALQQAKAVISEPISGDIEASWVAQMEGAGVALQDSAAALMDAAMAQLNAASFFKNMEENIRNNSAATREAIESGDISKLASPEERARAEAIEKARKENDWFKGFWNALGVTSAGAATLTEQPPQRTLAESQARLVNAQKELAQQQRLKEQYAVRGYGTTPVYETSIARLTAEINALNTTVEKSKAATSTEGMNVVDAEQPVIDRINAQIAELNAKADIVGADLDAVQEERRKLREAGLPPAAGYDRERVVLQDELGALNETIRSLQKEVAFRKTEQARVKALEPPVAKVTKVLEDRATRGREARDPKSDAAQKAAFKKWSEGKSMQQVSAAIGKEKVMQIQQQIGAFVDGIFGPQTLSKLQEHQRNRIDELSKIKDETAPTSDLLVGGGGQDQLIASGAQDSIVTLATTMTESTNVISTAFGTGATQIATAGTSAATSISSGMTTGGASAGQTIASAMINAAGTVGNTIAAAVRNAAANISVTATAAPAADTGGMAMA